MCLLQWEDMLFGVRENRKHTVFSMTYLECHNFDVLRKAVSPEIDIVGRVVSWADWAVPGLRS